MGAIEKAKTAKKIMDTVPKVDEPWNLILFIINILFPGIGTIIGGALTKAEFATYLVGIVQLLLGPFIIGWIWSIAWGWFIYDKKAMKKVVKKGVAAVSN